MHTLYIGFWVALLIQGAPSEASDGKVDVSPEALDFGPWQTGSRIADTIRIKNVSALAFTMTSLTLEGDVGFLLSPNPLTGDLLVVESTDAIQVPVAFSPESQTQYTGRIDFIIDARDYSLPVLGEGVAESIVINEILADPPAGDDGDANRDGGRHSSEDEFVEILNITRYPLPIEGFSLSDRGTRLSARFVFPPATIIDAGERIVLFGGGTPTGFTGQIFVDDGKIGRGLTNSGDVVYLISPEGDTVSVAEYGKEAGADQSIVRHPDGRGPFVRHKTPPGIDRFSPGEIRSPLSLIVAGQDTFYVSLGERFVPETFGVSDDSDTLDISDDLIWSTDTPSVLEWDVDAWVALLPGSATVTAHFDTVSSNPIPLVARLPEPFTLLTIPSDTVVLVGSEFQIQAIAQSDDVAADVTELADWRLSDGALAAETLPGRFLATGTGDGVLVVTLAERSATSLFHVSVPGDFDLDGEWTSADALRLIHIALEIPPSPRTYEILGADTNHDGVVDVIDLVDLVDRILGRPSTKSVPVVAVTWDQIGTTLSVQGPPVRAIVVELEEYGTLTASGLEVMGNRTLWMLSPENGEWIDTPLEVQTTGIVSRIFVLGDFGRRLASRYGTPHARLVAFPNPFNAQTVLEFSIRQQSDVMLDIYSILGQKVVELVRGVRPAGRHRFVWDGRDHSSSPLGSGVYVGRLRTETRTEFIRMVLLQ